MDFSRGGLRIKVPSVDLTWYDPGESINIIVVYLYQISISYLIITLFEILEGFEEELSQLLE